MLKIFRLLAIIKDHFCFQESPLRIPHPAGALHRQSIFEDYQMMADS